MITIGLIALEILARASGLPGAQSRDPGAEAPVVLAQCHDECMVICTPRPFGPDECHTICRHVCDRSSAASSKNSLKGGKRAKPRNSNR